MKFFDKFKKNKDIFPDELIVLQIDNLENVSSSTLQDAGKVLTEKNEPSIQETLPKLDLMQANILIQRIFELQVAPKATAFVIPEVVVHRMDNSDEFTIHNFTIDVDFQNMTKIIIDALFNEHELENTEYKDKVEFARFFQNAYEQKLGVDDQSVAQIPSEFEVEKGKVSTSVPSLSLGKELNLGAGKTAVQKGVSKLPKSPFVKKTSEKNSKEKNNNSTPSFSREVIHANEANGNIVTLGEDVNNQVESRYQIILPKFATSNMESVSPESDQYVAYRQNQKKIEFNQFLIEKEKHLNAKLKREILALRQQQQNYLNEQLAEFIKKNDGRNQVHDQVLAKMKTVRKQMLKDKQSDIDSERDKKITAENKRHNDILVQIKTSAEQNMVTAEKSITTDIANKTNTEIDAEINKQTEALEKSQKSFAADLEKAQETDVEDLALSGQTKGTDYGGELFKKLSNSLDSFTTQLVNEHSNANESLAAKRRAENNGKDIDAKFKENSVLSEENRQLRAKDATTITELARLKSENAELKANDHSADFSKLLLASQQGSTQKSPEQEQMASLLQLAIAKQIGSASEKNTEEKSDRGKNNGVKNWLIGGLAGLVLLVGGGTGIIVHNNDQNNIRMAKIEANQSSEHSRNNQLQSKIKTESSKRTDAEATASASEQKYEKQSENLTKANKQIQKLEKAAKNTNTSSSERNGGSSDANVN
ncbi:hypothetical protein N6G96_07225 [Pediococcus inopinatus]|uniref:Uncharacterized protein n=1 Tax=Pediococcus inopinatus TaxID=114090 RepID=A0ABZ0Q2A0_9LACO|nr:hypothetical protein [Pediococcus inopinatus]WPC21081.1 hypothetical protein N6G96_07225 [Pediococcus inopinatus]